MIDLLKDHPAEVLVNNFLDHIDDSYLHQTFFLILKEVAVLTCQFSFSLVCLHTQYVLIISHFSFDGW